jgi:glutamyl-tRNA reductase
VRTETGIARGTTSFAQAAVSMALEDMGEQFNGADVVVVGAGQLATGIVKSLLASPRQFARLTLSNRTITRAQQLRDALHDDRLNVAPLAELAEHTASARLIFVAVEVATPLITSTHLKNRTQPLLIVDLGLPRAVDGDVMDVAHVRKVDISDLRTRVELALDDRHGAVDEARQIVLDDVEKFLDDQRERGAAAIVSELREYFDEVVASEMKRREHELADMSDEQRDVVRSLLRSVVAKIAHRPTVALKDAAGMDQGIRLTEATRNLFDL